jgi:hypothetical protein
VGRYLDLARQTTDETSTPFPSTSINSRKNSGVSYGSQEAEPVPLVAGGSETSEPSERRSEPHSSLVVYRCIHEVPPDDCAVCNGYVRWLIARGNTRLAEARTNPEVARHRYWRLIKGGLADETR